MEYQADSFAVRKVGAEQYVQTLEKLNEISENKMMKGSVTHPSLKDRIKNPFSQTKLGNEANHEKKRTQSFDSKSRDKNRTDKLT